MWSVTCRAQGNALSIKVVRVGGRAAAARFRRRLPGTSKFENRHKFTEPAAYEREQLSAKARPRPGAAVAGRLAHEHAWRPTERQQRVGQCASARSAS